jgi:hypothetical protein
MLKLLSEQKALGRLRQLKDDFKQRIVKGYEHRAKSCLTCETQGACCLDAHFVNVHISRLEAVAIRQALENLPETKQCEIRLRVEETSEKYGLISEGDTYAQTFSCPLFEKGVGCLVHRTGKPVPCITHACYENAADLPPDDLQIEQEDLIDKLNVQTYGWPQPWLPLPLAIRERG